MRSLVPMRVLLILAVSSVLGTSPANTAGEGADECEGAGWTSAGCTFFADHWMDWGACRPSKGSSCYYCEYTCKTQRYYYCGENQDGSLKQCVLGPRIRQRTD